MKSSGDTFYEEKVVIDDVMCRLQWRVSWILWGLVEEDIGSHKYNQIYLDEMKQEVGASELTRLEPWKSKSVLGKYRLEPRRLKIGVFI